MHYSYLWHDQGLRGMEEGTKERPCVIVSAMTVHEGVSVTVVPITHRPPSAKDEAVEIPELTKQRLGLDSDRSWIMGNDFNLFLWPGPDLRPIPNHPGRYAYGYISGKLLQRVRDTIRHCADAGAVRATRRES